MATRKGKEQALLAGSGALPHPDTTPLPGCVAAGTEGSVHIPESLLCACPPAQQGCTILAFSDGEMALPGWL